MREDTCARCGQRIHLVKLDPTSFRWVTDPDKPDTTWRCEIEGLRKSPEGQRHAPASMQASRR